MNNNFYNLLNYYKCVSISKKLIEQRVLTKEESESILEKLKQHYKIQEILDESNISDL